ncbi:MAG: helix-turn-helix domain-containing protein [Acidobacteria bacterium]|nr:helix-turn-helix domain-containing protein [Acidobacteriota bacterium]
MTVINVKLTAKELELLTSLASDQLFRREFIDPKMPGHTADASSITLGKNLVSRLRALANPGAAARTANGKSAG